MLKMLQSIAQAHQDIQISTCPEDEACTRLKRTLPQEDTSSLSPLEGGCNRLEQKLAHAQQTSFFSFCPGSCSLPRGEGWSS